MNGSGETFISLQPLLCVYIVTEELPLREQLVFVVIYCGSSCEDASTGLATSVIEPYCGHSTKEPAGGNHK
jgi:hypothetical protein